MTENAKTWFRKIPSYLGLGHRLGIEFNDQEEHELEMFWLDREKEWSESLPTKSQREKMFGEEGLRLKEKYQNEEREEKVECYRKMYRLNYPKWLREMVAEDIRLRVKTTGGKVSDEMIARAKEYPIEKLIKVNRGMARCISGTHEDKKPSMNCKNNYAYCHACGYHADTIKILMDLENINFIEAVKRLQ